MRRLRSVILVFLGLASFLTGQEGGQWLQVEGATGTAVGVLWSHGFEDDAVQECGLARVMTTCRLESGRRAAGELLASGLHVGGDYALVFGVVNKGESSKAVAFLLATLGVGGNAQELSDDDIALAVARAALAADDAESVYPGSILLSRARQRLGHGTTISRPPAGIASAIAKLTPKDVRTALRQPVPVRVAGLGIIDADLLAVGDRLRTQEFATQVRGGLICTDLQTVREISEDLNDRTDSPYVMAAFAAPQPNKRAAFAIGMGVATSRAFKRWGYRGFEQQARAPFVAWSWLHADPIVQFCRRGANPYPLRPGERPTATAGDEMRATTAELAAFLEDLRLVKPTETEFLSARRSLRARLKLPKKGGSAAWATEPATLPGRLQALLLGAHHGIHVANLDSVTAEDVHACVREVLRVERASWHALLPKLVSRYGYHRR